MLQTPTPVCPAVLKAQYQSHGTETQQLQHLCSTSQNIFYMESLSFHFKFWFQATPSHPTQ